MLWNQPGLERRLFMLSPSGRDRVIFAVKLLSNIYWWAMLALALVGAHRLACRRPRLLCLTAPPVLIWAYFTVMHALTVVQDRYHFITAPLIALLAATGIRPVGERLCRF